MINIVNDRFEPWIAKLKNGPETTKVIYVDMDDVLCDFTEASKTSKCDNPSIGFPQCQYGFFGNLKPLPNAIEAMNLLMWSTEMGLLDVNISTAPSLLNPLSYTEKRIWVEENLGMFWVERLYIVPDKSRLIGNILIDDNISGHGQEKFNGELIHFGSKTYPNWKSIMKRTDDFMKFCN